MTISTGARCCDAVKAFAGTRILATQAPTLPMKSCSMPAECRCRFKKHEDRREEEQGRRSIFGHERASWYAGGQRRKSRGRRNQD